MLAFHVFGEPFSGGFVGVDVFFVISGFLITGHLLGEYERTGRVSVLGFYARRVRRILPASVVLVVATVLITYPLLGFIVGNEVATTAQWTSVFAENIQLALIGTDYLGSQLPPSPLQHMWSLGVEEQFYVVWPALFLGVALLVSRRRLRTVFAAVLAAVIATSFAWSAIQTATNAVWAYYSPLTRAWELALGALVAVLSPVIARAGTGMAAQVAAAAGAVGIAVSAVALDSTTPYPGAAAAYPVVSAALLIAAGCADSATVTGRVLSVRPMQWVGARSYSLYLWHWPILAIAAQYLGHEMTASQNAGLLLGCVAAAAVSFRLLEQPVRRSATLRRRPGLSLAVGAALILGTIALCQWTIAAHYAASGPFSIGPAGE